MYYKAILITIYLLLHAQVNAQFISNSGTSIVSDNKTQVEVKFIDGNKKRLSIVVIYPNNFKGGFTELKVVEGKWKAFFEAPNKLWVYDGNKTVHLSKFLQNPKGFKNVSSTKVPSLLEQVPKELKSIISK
jgi:hypothetical protein